MKRRPVIDDFDLDRLANACEGYVGAEIEQAIEDALLKGFNQGGREFTTDDICKTLKEIIPISQSQVENIRKLRGWLEEGRAKSASFPEKGSAMKEQVQLPDFGAAPAIEV